AGERDRSEQARMAGRTIAIGDIHGCPDALAALIDAIAPSPEDTVVLLGDYIDRGPNSRGVLDRLIALARRCRLVPLLGNHEEALLDALRDKDSLRRWLTLGAADTLRSYGWVPGGPRRALADWIPKPHGRRKHAARGARGATGQSLAINWCVRPIQRV